MLESRGGRRCVAANRAGGGAADAAADDDRPRALRRDDQHRRRGRHPIVELVLAQFSETVGRTHHPRVARNADVVAALGSAILGMMCCSGAGRRGRHAQPRRLANSASPRVRARLPRPRARAPGRRPRSSSSRPTRRSPPRSASAAQAADAANAAPPSSAEARRRAPPRHELPPTTSTRRSARARPGVGQDKFGARSLTSARVADCRGGATRRKPELTASRPRSRFAYYARARSRRPPHGGARRPPSTRPSDDHARRRREHLRERRRLGDGECYAARRRKSALRVRAREVEGLRGCRKTCGRRCLDFTPSQRMAAADRQQSRMKSARGSVGGEDGAATRARRQKVMGRMNIDLLHSDAARPPRLTRRGLQCERAPSGRRRRCGPTAGAERFGRFHRARRHHRADALCQRS